MDSKTEAAFKRLVPIKIGDLVRVKKKYYESDKYFIDPLIKLGKTYKVVGTSGLHPHHLLRLRVESRHHGAFHIDKWINRFPVQKIVIPNNKGKTYAPRQTEPTKTNPNGPTYEDFHGGPDNQGPYY